VEGEAAGGIGLHGMKDGKLLDEHLFARLKEQWKRAGSQKN